MSNLSSSDKGERHSITSRAHARLALLLALAVAAVALTYYFTLGAGTDPVAAFIQPQAAQAGTAQHNPALAAEVPMSADLEAQDNVTPSASCLERLYIQQQLELDMCEGACGR